MKILIVIVMFILIGAFFIISQNNLALKEPENIEKFASLYSGWAINLFDNFGDATGYIIKMDWLPKSS